MALAEYRMGALCVVENVSDTDWINRRLKQIDGRLFVEKQLTFAEEEVWCVVEDTGEQYGADRFVCVYEFRGPDGRPVPYLTERIVEVMLRRAQEGTGNVLEARKIAQQRNAERQQRIREETDGHYHDIAKDFQDHRTMGNFMVVPRSRQLARTRARVRSQTVEQLRAVEEAKRIARHLAGR